MRPGKPLEPLNRSAELRMTTKRTPSLTSVHWPTIDARACVKRRVYSTLQCDVLTRVRARLPLAAIDMIIRYYIIIMCLATTVVLGNLGQER